MVNNDGVDIQTDEDAKVRCIFDGTVTNVFAVTGSNWLVMIKHGNYFTVYSGLASVSVRKDDEVSVKQALGKVALNSEGLPVVNFQIWKSGTGAKKSITLNPEQWIGKAR
jgi:murein DD-endopeptidase MepM/ murein hydrolase activator NlpD